MLWPEIQGVGSAVKCRPVALPEQRRPRARRSGNCTTFPDTLQPVVQAVVEAFGQGGSAAARQLGVALGVSAQFDQTNPLTLSVVRARGAALVTAVTDETRAAIRAVIARSFSDGIPPRQVAQLLRPLIGLTERDSLAVVNFRFALLEQGLPPTLVANRAEFYAARLLRQRAETIACTELIHAANAGQQALWEQSVRDGVLPPETQRLWLVTPDDRLCPICAPMEDHVREVQEAFVSPYNGSTASVPPIHPRCRCAVAISSVPVSQRRAVA